MSESTSKADRRELRKVLGAQAAEMVATQRDLVAALKRENEALAVEFVKLRSIVTKEIDVLHGRIDGASKWCDKNEGSIGAERTHRLKLADEQRSYVDGADREIRGALTNLEARVTTTNTRLCAVELALEDEQGNQHDTTQRELDTTRRELDDLDARLKAFVNMGFLDRVWWCMGGGV